MLFPVMQLSCKNKRIKIHATGLHNNKSIFAAN